MRAVSVDEHGDRPDSPGTSIRYQEVAVLVDADVTPVDATTAGQVYVIEHAMALVLFDTGQDRASVTDDAYSPADSPAKSSRSKSRCPTWSSCQLMTPPLPRACPAPDH